MPILANLKRRFGTLTTDAIPDPPRDNAEGMPCESLSSLIEPKSAPVTSEVTKECDESSTNLGRQNSAPAKGSAREEHFDFSKAPDEEPKFKTTGARTKRKLKIPSGAKIVNYNIVNSNGVEIGAKTSYICNVNHYSEKASATPKEKSKRMPRDVEELSILEDEIGFDEMFLVKTHLGHGWRDVSRCLGYSEGQIQQFEENHKDKGVDQVIYQMLLDWKQANTKEATIGALVRTMWSCREYDCAERLAANRKTPS